ncbi:MAG: glycosyltransferase family 39 protein [Elusimicrobia bacterium]|nr:glycosyltransferase family 39 protein [Elusimicrobiota bacterium]
MSRRGLAGLSALLFSALLVRLVGIAWGLPHTFNGDEPHLVNLAVSFGGGSLRPYAFKYPTLWPYLLFILYGLYFLLWSCLGLCRGLGAFVGHFAWHPAPFYLMGRVLSAFFSVAGLAWVWKMEREARPGGEGLAWGAILLAFSPVLSELGHAAKPDSLMFFLAAAGWYWAFRLQREGGRLSYWACGFFLGLAFSAQYTALPLWSLLPLAHVLRLSERPHRFLLEGLAALGLGFLAGTPYALLDFPGFWAGIRDHMEQAALYPVNRRELLKSILANMAGFSGSGLAGGAACLLGFFLLAAGRSRLALLSAGPLLFYILALSGNPDGGWPRYLAGGYPGLAFLASRGLSWIERPRKAWLAAAAALIVVLPGFLSCLSLDREMRRADTRQEAARWIRENIPAGEAVLLDQPDASPGLPMAREQALELWERTRRLGSPRARLYRAMADFHPGGGYRIYRIQHSARGMDASPRHVALSQADSSYADVRPGLDVAKALRIRYVVTSSYGARPDREPEYAMFFEELARDGRLLRTFSPVPGRLNGPVLQVYGIMR